MIAEHRDARAGEVLHDRTASAETRLRQERERRRLTCGDALDRDVRLEDHARRRAARAHEHVVLRLGFA